MAIGPTSHLPDPDERIVGLITLQLLDTWRVWVKRRVESVSFPDVATQTRHISVDFELPAAIVDAARRALRARADDQAEVRADEAQVDDVWVPDGRTSFVLVPLTVLRKQGLTRFSLRDESGTALPLLTRDQTGAVATAVLVTLAEGLHTSGGGTAGLPPELRSELVRIATLPPTQATAVWDDLDRPKKGDTARCNTWRHTLVSSEGFMAMALDLAQNFLLLTRLVAEPGRRRIIKISYEHHLRIPASGDVTGRLRRVRRLIGWGAHTERIDTPAVGLGRCFISRSRLRTAFRSQAPD